MPRTSGVRRRSGTTPLKILYRRLMRAYGPQGWWPAESPFEMMVGAILTQATNWHNVEQAMSRLKQAGPVRSRTLLAMSRRRLERAIQPSGYFRQKAERLTAFSRWYLRRFGVSPRRMFRTPWRVLRVVLLTLKGNGP